MDLALNNLQKLMCHKTQTNKLTKSIDKKLDGNYSTPHKIVVLRPHASHLTNHSSKTNKAREALLEKQG